MTAEPRAVTFVWLHGDERRETMGFLQPVETIALAASVALDRPLQRPEVDEPVPARLQPLLDECNALYAEMYAHRIH